MFEKPDLTGKVALVTGSTRGIGKDILLSLADCGCNVVSTGRTSKPLRSREGTIHQTAKEAQARGNKSLAIKMNVRDKQEIYNAIDETINEFGRLDILINNAGAVLADIDNITDMLDNMGSVETDSVEKFEKLFETNVRAAYICSRAAIPHMKKQDHGHILMNSPPIGTHDISGRAAYGITKFGMTLLAKALAEELREYSIGVNTFWPSTAIESRATQYYSIGTERDWRDPQIVSDAVLEIVSRHPDDCTGNAFYDEKLLQEVGVEDFSQYNVVDGVEPEPYSALMFDPDYERY
ncbi:SDR family oxidoreductase [Halocatena halophila]|uniref:SDR family oxidoreductase n=1 Tax=Halocatena halophila TaxID=2814576 RepID=UPI002ED3666F